MVKRVVIILATLFFTMFSIFPKIYYTGTEEVSLIKTIETLHSFISYVKIKNHIYLVKQKKIYKPNHKLAVVREALAAFIAESLNDLAHEVYIIGPKKKFPGKIKQELPATLHTIAGNTIREQKNCKYKMLRLRQFWAHTPFKDKGLTTLIINHMTWHKQLAMIVALDLIIGNSDRHCGNICYDPQTDTFRAIDMDDTFNKDLCRLAYKKLKSMLKDNNIVFTKQELNALSVMKDTLKFLVNKHRPEVLIEKLYYFAHKAGLSKGSKLYNAQIAERLLYYEKMIIQTNKSAVVLLSLLDKIINHKSLLIITSKNN